MTAKEETPSIQPWLFIDPWIKTPRVNQVFDSIARRLTLGDKPRHLAMHSTKTALPRTDRAKLLQDINNSLGKSYGFVAQWSGSRKGHLILRLKWNTS